MGRLFTKDIEDSLTNFVPDTFSSIDHAVKSFNAAITSASRRHIPSGNRRNHKPHFSQYIHKAMKTRNAVRRKTRPTDRDISTINTLNKQIDGAIRQQKSDEWRTYLDDLTHKTKSKFLLRTIKRIHIAQLTPHPPMKHPQRIPPFPHSKIKPTLSCATMLKSKSPSNPLIVATGKS